MSVGGTIVEIIHLNSRVWINTMDAGRFCAIYVERFDGDVLITPGDHIWWQGDNAFWTPASRECKDIPLVKLGYSGVSRPTDKDTPLITPSNSPWWF
jgi:hypothetical protein